MGLLNAIETIIGTIRFKRGLKENLPTLKYGEPAYTYDENELYIGGKDGDEIVNKKITRNSEVAANTEAINNLTESVANNTTSLNASVKKTKAKISYYVNSETGNDSNDGLTKDTALKSFEMVCSKIPEFLEHNLAIHVKGEFNTEFNIPKICGVGSLMIVCNDDGERAIIPNIVVNNVNNVFVNIAGAHITTSKKDGININTVNRVHISDCVIDSVASDKYGIYCAYADVTLYNNTINNKMAGIVGITNANIYSSDNHGSNNVYGLQASYGGTIMKNGEQPSGTTSNELSSNGGEIR